MYYAFFARNWKEGTLELRGPDDRAYHIVDYVDERLRNRPRSGHALIRRVFETSYAGSNSATDLLNFVAEGRRKQSATELRIDEKQRGESV